jgi:hypothetical protein
VDLDGGGNLRLLQANARRAVALKWDDRAHR